MHLVNDIPPYKSSIDAISKFPETATALGLKQTEHNDVIRTASCGIEDLLALTIKPTPYFAEDEKLYEIYRQRIAKKSWKSIWPEVEAFQSKV